MKKATVALVVLLLSVFAAACTGLPGISPTAPGVEPMSASLVTATPSDLTMAGCKLFVLAGQSNMVGRGVVADLPPEERALPHNVELHAVALDWDLEPVQGLFGPELGFARVIGPAYADETIVLVKYAVEGASLLDWSPDWDPETAALTGRPDFGSLYQKLMALIGQVREEVGADCQVSAILWMQGERDARFPEAAGQYRENLTNLVRHFRHDLGIRDLPFLLARINPPADGYPAAETVRLAQADVMRADEYTWLIHTEQLPKHDDDVHYNTFGQIELGRRFAQAFVMINGH